jgi:hypothetical protein
MATDVQNKKKSLVITPHVGSGDSAAVWVGDMVSCVIQVTATDWTAGSYQAAVSYDGTNFVNLGSAVTGANGSVAVPDAALAVRLHTTTNATAGAAAAVSGLAVVQGN